MANITITIPDANLSRVIDGFATRYEYNTFKQGAETKAQFAKRMLIASIKRAVIEGEAEIAKGIATNTSTTEVEAITIN